jgi:hypothetical protein
VLHHLADTGQFSVSEVGCAPSSFTATSENTGAVTVSANDGLGTFTLTAVTSPSVHNIPVDVTDCHGFTTTNTSTPPSVKVQVVP